MVAVLRKTGSSGLARVDDPRDVTLGPGEETCTTGSDSSGAGGAGSDVGAGAAGSSAMDGLAAGAAAAIAPATAVFPMNARSRSPAVATAARAIGFAKREPITRATKRDDAPRKVRIMASCFLA
jgi:hypothetical protein